ncbi:ParA family protein [Jiangella aurantiaca]|uniref:ParA family protein n=1 Tax=Jiangella aurantiaca TaxID=2530373 RepID=A0A4R5A1V5_9ACTN|nr:ParA family protein [Jiangella aurantiaca]TDD64766.1 ParA family protein [Jiangella aurantiaca]
MATGIVIVVGMLKGGSGKTTTAMFTGLTYAQRGRRVLLLDGDQTSQSAYDWSQLAAAAGEPLPFTVERYPFEDIAAHIDRARTEWDVVIVDAGGGSATYLEEAVSAADLLLIPTAPAAADTRRLAATLASATRGADRNSRGVSAVMVMVRADHRTGQPASWRDQLVADGHTLAATDIRDLVLYSDAYGHTPPHAGEYPALLAEVGLLDDEAEVPAR